MYENNIEFKLYVGLCGVHINGCKFIDDTGSFEATSIDES
ncbi:hypothetical protein SDC9_40590 [bioreactor metagenome]|uniref:Uncharacterized protein n=1 Tax=bioreactor metagenome TaxID=1076179 RepID=A0A644VT24_9ZZZZ